MLKDGSRSEDDPVAGPQDLVRPFLRVFAVGLHLVDALPVHPGGQLATSDRVELFDQSGDARPP